jgi:3-oxoadipate enol-lactonase
VLAYDLRGAGMSEKIAGDVTIDDFTDDLHALLAALDIQLPVVLVGSALGAAPAIHFAAKYPQQTRGLVAFSPACSMAPDRRQAAYELADRTAQLGVRAARPAPAGAAPPVRGLSYAAISLAGDGRSQAAWRRMLADLDMDSDFGKIACPALFIGATQDTARPPALTEAIARQVPGAHYQELDTGHFAAWQTPDLTAEAISNFLLSL